MRISMLMAVMISICQARAAAAGAHFPQNRVDQVCARQPGSEYPPARRDALSTLPPSDEARVSAGPGRGSSPLKGLTLEEYSAKADLIIGPLPETLYIDTNYVQNGNILILGYGVLIVDGSMLDLSGHLAAFGHGKAVFRNGAWFHFNQYWVGQYYAWLTDSSSFEATDATVDANGVMHYAEVHSHGTYVATRTSFPDWTFRKCFDHSTLLLEDVYHVGDLMVDDSCYVHFIRCDTLMPWFETPDGSAMDIVFPSPDSVDHFELSESTPGVDGIGYTFVADTCWRCWWSLETLPGCSVVVRNSEIRGSCIRMPGADTFTVCGIANYKLHPDLLLPMHDRHLEYVNTYVYWWNWYPLGTTVFNIDSCVFGEMIGKEASETYATGCIHDGATIMLGSVDSAFVSFADGLSLSFAGSFRRSTLLLTNTVVTPMWPYQRTNMAHNESYMLCVNCHFDSLPFALDTALVMFAAVYEPDTGEVGDSLAPIGSAWIDPGPYNPTTFDRYRLYWRHADSLNWTLCTDSTGEVFNGTLGIWNTSGLEPGEYHLRLTIWDDAGDSLTALREVTLLTTGVKESPLRRVSVLRVYPNPFTHSTTITFLVAGCRLPVAGNRQLGTGNVQHVSLSIFDLSGRLIRTVVPGSIDCPTIQQSNQVVWDGRDLRGVPVPSGVYFCRFQTEEGAEVRKIARLR